MPSCALKEGETTPRPLSSITLLRVFVVAVVSSGSHCSVTGLRFGPGTGGTGTGFVLSRHAISTTLRARGAQQEVLMCRRERGEVLSGQVREIRLGVCSLLNSDSNSRKWVVLSLKQPRQQDQCRRVVWVLLSSETSAGAAS